MNNKIKELLKTLTEEEKDAIYRSVWFDRVTEDIKSRLKDTSDALTPDQIEYAAFRYVYDGQYDCTLAYWNNIDGVIQLAKDFHK